MPHFMVKISLHYLIIACSAKYKVLLLLSLLSQKATTL